MVNIGLTLLMFRADVLIQIENLNELLLLTLQSVCNNQSIKIPWLEVARTMGNNTTEGAIVQHLAKLRTRRAADGKQVPPPLRRGGVGSLNSKHSPDARDTKRKLKLTEVPSSDDDEPNDNIIYEDTSDEGYSGKVQRLKGKRRMIPRTLKEPRNQHDEEDTDSDPDELLVAGAAFLQYPNDKAMEEYSSTPPGLTATKLVVLKYGRSSVSESSGDNIMSYQRPVTGYSVANSMSYSAVDHDMLSYPGLYQAPAPDLSTEGQCPLGYYPASFGIPQVSLGEGSSGNLVPGEQRSGYPDTSLQGYQPNAFCNPSDDIMGFPPNLFGGYDGDLSDEDMKFFRSFGPIGNMLGDHSEMKDL
ncbi:hypothetical protein BDV25DRAFT_153164 [Aspergillus avenaceus]|uniref:Uncharacterized protein n=1 Tax=Aspergillus avenaceus TaxID=36643 RepID=A0A5N6TYN5_ASPAV|nr:hypothetical protein BDV25DRAFT_153164 [Aspergillus avenaceus]